MVNAASYPRQYQPGCRDEENLLSPRRCANFSTGSAAAHSPAPTSTDDQIELPTVAESNHNAAGLGSTPPTELPEARCRPEASCDRSAMSNDHTVSPFAPVVVWYQFQNAISQFARRFAAA